MDQSLNGNRTRVLGVSCRETLWRFRQHLLLKPTYEVQASISEEKLEADATEMKSYSSQISALSAKGSIT